MTNSSEEARRVERSNRLEDWFVFYPLFLISAVYVALAAFEIIDRENAINSAERTIRSSELEVEKWKAKKDDEFEEERIFKSEFVTEKDSMNRKEVLRYEGSKLELMRLQRSYFRSMRDAGAPRLADYAELKYVTGLCKLNVVKDHIPVITELLYREDDSDLRRGREGALTRCFYRDVLNSNDSGDPWLLYTQFRLTGQFGNEILIFLILTLSGGMGSLLRDFVRAESYSIGSWFVGIGVGFFALLALKSGKFLFLIPGEEIDLTTNPYGGAASAFLLGLTWRRWLPALFERLTSALDQKTESKKR